MSVIPAIVLGLAAWLTQGTPPSYVERGDAVEAQFRAHAARLEAFFDRLREAVARSAPEWLPELEAEDPPPQPGVHGYQLLPEIVDEADASRRTSVSTFSYSWPITEIYIQGEARKLDAAVSRFDDAAAGPRIRAVLRDSIDLYRALINDLETIDQYVQYNRFWQRAIVEDRVRFDRMTALYDTLAGGTSGDTNDAVAELLGRPDVPVFVAAEGTAGGTPVLRLPVYTDIEDDTFLDRVEAGVEAMWRVESAGTLDVRFRRIPAGRLYAGGRAPDVGDPIDLVAHAARFPDDGAVLTTGAESTHGFVGRYVALGPGSVTVRTLAHEFGHVLGFVDGYLRGYRNLGDDGFEILEWTSGFDDIMSAPREGRVLRAHFERMIEAIEGRGE